MQRRATQAVLGEYYYKDIQRILLPNDAPGGLVVAYGKQGRLHFFVCDKVEEIIRQILERVCWCPSRHLVHHAG
jgi:hypothetical protein